MNRLLPDDTVQSIKEILNGLENDVKLVFFESEGCLTCDMNRQLYTELAQINPHLLLEVLDIDSEQAGAFDIEVTPTLVVTDVESKHRILFTGTPHGHEFSSLLDAILITGGIGTKLPEKIADRVKAVGRNVTIQVFVSPTCPYCPMALKAAFPLAVSTENVVVQMIQATEFPDWAQRKRVMGVPKIVINDMIEIEGAVQTGRLVDAITNMKENARA